MKARLIKRNNKYELLLCSGEHRVLNLQQIQDFFENYNDGEMYDYSAPSIDAIPINEVDGKTLAVVTSTDILCIYDNEFLKELFLDIRLRPVNLISVQEYADIHKKQRAIIHRHIRNNRIPGATKIGNAYFIPENAPYPEDLRSDASNK